MATKAQVGGYLLEEVIAWLLRRSGYELLTERMSGDPALEMTGAGLAVRGRGARHQADVLGEFPFTPPFSLPIRMFVEAKSYQLKEPVGLGVVRNAWATVCDVNEFDVGMTSNRYRYVYTLFSTSGFTDNAVEFAMTHQISVVDLTLPMFDALRIGVEQAASTVHPHVVGAGTVGRFRQVVRHVLGTAVAQLPPGIPGQQTQLDAIRRLRSELEASFGDEILLAFPPAPFMLALTGDIDGFLRHAARRRDHRIDIVRDAEDRTATGWIIRPVDDSNSADNGDFAYTLRFSLPHYLDEWLMIGWQSTRQVEPLGRATIVIYRMFEGIPRPYELRYGPRPHVQDV
ncbi:hypothetical protein O7634_12900 [Micromonospora sp. WMMD1120]|uniref:hypothetical protein n=1 Tax=Micromonospora sp. WMMD1120 TaxID=3016106 RepID=UPI00241628E7|nr:hypothetical protein [Micromonospora sp. WMMD1120]MDG4807651.1 hypothetical protein [Micromonospora sp. WMMD1120]